MTKSKDKNSTSNYSYEGIGLRGDDKKKAKKLFKDYRNHYDIENLSDLNILETLVFREIMNYQMLEKIAEVGTAGGKDNVVPGHLMKELTANQENILVLKEKLGLFEEKEVTDAFKYLTLLFKKFKLWCQRNKDSRSIGCPHCGKLLFLKMRTTAYEAHISPFFDNKIIANKPLFDLYKKKKINQQDVADVLDVSTDYVKILEEKYK